MNSNADDQYSSRGSPGLSMRTWLYLGSALLALALGSLRDRIVDETPLRQEVEETENSSARHATSSRGSTTGSSVLQERPSKVEVTGRTFVR